MIARLGFNVNYLVVCWPILQFDEAHILLLSTLVVGNVSTMINFCT